MTINAADSHILEVQSVIGNIYNADGDSDVLAVVRFDGDDKGEACGGGQWRDLQIRMSSERLKSLGSSKINGMFAPHIQKRMCRRLGYQNFLPPGIKYVLDFTPPAEGSELADLTAALWLPKMVKLWFLAGLYMPEEIIKNGPKEHFPRPMGDRAAGAILTLGHDDACRNDTCRFSKRGFTLLSANFPSLGLEDLSQWRVNPNVPGIVDEDPFSSEPKYIPPSRRVDDYCRIRHRVALMRVLRAINGHGLMLNSATRMWTIAQVAIHLEVPRIVVSIRPLSPSL